MTEYCNKTWLIRYLSEELDLDEQLEFLFHLDECLDCYESLYTATKAKHPHYYKMSARQLKISERELQKLESPASQEIVEVA